MKHNIKTKFYFIVISAIILGGCFFSLDAYSATIGDSRSFYLDSGYDVSNREEISATLQKISNRLYFYIDDIWLEKLSFEDRNKLSTSLNGLADEFEIKIYPTLTSIFGSEWKPGIDNDEHITVLVHQMKQNQAGYFRTEDEYPKFVATTSNEREMFYFSSDYIMDPLNKSFLAHEFMHLVSFNQKDRIQNIAEEIWLNEARAEYASTLLGYDSKYQGSNLQRRVNEFLRNPSDSIIDWQNSSADYGALNLFIQYLVDHYGVKILTDSLHSSKKGIESINYALIKNGYKEDFSQVFTDWTIAALLNDCSLGVKYCYKNENLKSLKVTPVTNFLPLNSQSALSVNYIIKNWTGNWQRIIGGGGILTLDFNGGSAGNIQVPYVVCEVSGSCSVNFLALDDNHIGKIELQDFNTKYASLTIIPMAQENSNSVYYFFWEVKMTQNVNDETELINQLLSDIASLKIEIARVQAQIDVILGKKTISCQRLESNLYFGIRDNQKVSCLQEFLKNQGSDIYPEGLVTGNFLSLTKIATIRFQERYANEILKPLGLERGTGYVGPATRAKINQLFGF